MSAAPAPPPEAYAVEAHDLTRTFGAFTAVDRVTFAVYDARPGQPFVAAFKEHVLQ